MNTDMTMDETEKVTLGEVKRMLVNLTTDFKDFRAEAIMKGEYEARHEALVANHNALEKRVEYLERRHGPSWTETLSALVPVVSVVLALIAIYISKGGSPS